MTPDRPDDSPDTRPPDNAPAGARSAAGDIGQPQPPTGRVLRGEAPLAQLLDQALNDLRTAASVTQGATQAHTPAVLIDLADAGSAAWLSDLAQAAGQPLQQLRLQDTARHVEATLAYVDLPLQPAGTLRLYRVPTDRAAADLAEVLVRHVALLILMLGDAAAAPLPARLAPLRRWLATPDGRLERLSLLCERPVTRRALLPLADGLRAGTGLPVSVGACGSGPLPVWQALVAAWDGEGSTPARPRLPRLAPCAGAPSTRPASLTPGDARREGPLTFSVTAQSLVEGLAVHPGVVEACVFEMASSRVLASAGPPGNADALARAGTLLLTAAEHARARVGISTPAGPLTLAGGNRLQVVTPLEGWPGIALHLISNPQQADWPQLRPVLLALQAAAREPLPPAAPGRPPVRTRRSGDRRSGGPPNA